MIRVDTDVPMPPHRLAPNQRYPWHQLEVGHSFFVPNGNVKSLQCSASKRKAKGEAYIARTVEGGVRVWRTA